MPVCVEVETVTQDTKIRAVQTTLEMKSSNTLAWKSTVSSLSTGSIAAPCLSPTLRPTSHRASQSLQFPKTHLQPPEMLLQTPICSVPQLKCTVPLVWHLLLMPSAYGSMDKGSCSWHLLLDSTCTLGTTSITIPGEGNILHKTGISRFSSFLLQSDDPLRMHFSVATCQQISGLGKQQPT